MRKEPRLADIDASLSREALVEKYKPLARSVAARFFGLGAPILGNEDHVGEALRALVDAAERWEPGRVLFGTFATRYCRGYVLNQIRAASGFDTQTFDQRTRIRDAENVCIQRGVEPNDENMADVLETYIVRGSNYTTLKPVTPDVVNDWRKATRGHEPLTASDEPADVEVGDPILAIELERAMRLIPQDTRQMLERRANGDRLVDIGADFGVSYQTVANHTEAAKAVLREALAPVAREYGYA